MHVPAGPVVHEGVAHRPVAGRFSPLAVSVTVVLTATPGTGEPPASVAVIV